VGRAARTDPPEDRKDRQKQVVLCREAAERFESKINRLGRAVPEAGVPAESILSMTAPIRGQEARPTRSSAYRTRAQGRRGSRSRPTPSADHKRSAKRAEAAAEEMESECDKLAPEGGFAIEGEPGGWRAREGRERGPGRFDDGQEVSCGATRLPGAFNACDHVKKSMKDLANLAAALRPADQGVRRGVLGPLAPTIAPSPIRNLPSDRGGFSPGCRTPPRGFGSITLW
jgi:hypothetical protein